MNRNSTSFSCLTFALAMGAALWTGSSAGTSVSAAPAQGPLKGIYTGTYVGENVMGEGSFSLNITFDRIVRGARIIKGNATIDRTTYGGGIGAFDENTLGVVVTKRLGSIRRPRGAAVTSGTFNAELSQLTGRFTLSETNAGERRYTITLSRSASRLD